MSEEKQIEEMANHLAECHTEISLRGAMLTDYEATARKMTDKGYHRIQPSVRVLCACRQRCEGMRSKRDKDGYLLKSEVQLLIQNYIRNIQMNDYGNDSGIPQLYAIMKQIDNLPTVDIKGGDE